MLAVSLSGCVQPPVDTTPSVQPDAEAYALLDQRRYLEAAYAFETLSQSASAPLKQEYQLLGADALLQAGDRSGARQRAQSVSTAGLSSRLSAHRNLILAELESADGNPGSVLELLSASSPRPDTLERRGRFHLLRAQAFEQLGQQLTAARERISADPFIDTPAQPANRESIWLNLARTPVAQLSSADTSSPATLEGWVNLALIARRLITDPVVFEEALTRWTSTYPGHPAQNLVSSLTDASLLKASTPDHIALLLPLEGPFARAAAAIRDGFLAAWYQTPDTSERPRVSIWNTAGQDIDAIYAQAIDAGAQFVVGPLDKPSVTALAARAPLAVDTLALNVADVSANPEDESTAESTATQTVASITDTVTTEPSGVLYHFALSPEEEARRVAERAWSEGHVTAAMIVPTGSWGQRVSDAFQHSWEELGGAIPESRLYEHDAKDMSEPVATLLGVDRSKERAKTLGRYLGLEIEHSPRRRKDVDFIFMAAQPKQARLLRPQLLFHHASDVPVYSTSHVYTGVPNPGADIDINGVQFGDMPWVLKPGGAEGTLRISTEAAWPGSFTGFVRFYAFGTDAYRILPHLGILRAQPYIEFPGETGSLSVNAESQIQRGLSWAQFVDGVPQPLELEALEQR